MVSFTVRNALALVAAVPAVLAHPAELTKRRGGDFYCGTSTTAKDYENFQIVADAGRFPGYASLHARDRIVSRDTKYPWGNVTIKTWIHVIAPSANSTDNVPQQKLLAQMDYLNANFGKFGRVHAAR